MFSQSPVSVIYVVGKFSLEWVKLYIRHWKAFVCLSVYFHSEYVVNHQINIFRRELSEKAFHNFESGYCRDLHSSQGRYIDTYSFITFKLGIDKEKILLICRVRVMLLII